MLRSALLLALLEAAIKRIGPEIMKAAVDRLLDFIEDQIADSETQVDDRVLLPLIANVRVAFDVPDNDVDVIDGSTD